MCAKVKRVNIVVDDLGFFVKPGKLNITDERLLEYIKDHPMPTDPNYTLEELTTDLTDGDSHGLYFLPEKINKETMHYVEKLIDHFKKTKVYGN